MNIAIITDYLLSHWVGGGTLVNDYLGRRITAAGHKLEFILINGDENGWETAVHTRIDLYLVTNIPYMTEAQMRQLMLSKIPYVMFRHDVASICYLPDAASHPASGLILDMFRGARSNIFISNIQLAYYRRMGSIDRTVVIPPPLDLSEFTDTGMVERQGHLYIGDINEQRGIFESLQSMKANPEGGSFSFYGEVDVDVVPVIEAAGGKVFPVIAHSLVAPLMNTKRHFYYHPKMIDAFCLKVLEAELCGMELHVDRGNIGRFYYDATAQQLADFMKNQSVDMILEMLR